MTFIMIINIQLMLNHFLSTFYCFIADMVTVADMVQRLDSGSSRDTL